MFGYSELAWSTTHFTIRVFSKPYQSLTDYRNFIKKSWYRLGITVQAQAQDLLIGYSLDFSIWNLTPLSCFSFCSVVAENFKKDVKVCHHRFCYEKAAVKATLSGTAIRDRSILSYLFSDRLFMMAETASINDSSLKRLRLQWLQTS